MKRLVSRKRSTQLARQLSSLLEKDEEGAPVMHLGPTVRRGREGLDPCVLVPTHACEIMDGRVEACLGLLTLEKAGKLFLKEEGG